ncbi:hypothetical protein [Escherichia coli]
MGSPSHQTNDDGESARVINTPGGHTLHPGAWSYPVLCHRHLILPISRR